jgi:hypothetical protein
MPDSFVRKAKVLCQGGEGGFGSMPPEVNNFRLTEETLSF